MKRMFTFIIVSLCFHVSFAQTDSLDILNDTVLVKGFYKTYQEFLANNPSVRRDFTTTYNRIGKHDSTIVSATYVLPESEDNFGEIWGFCDGKNVFFASGTFFVLKYWKLQCRGPNPYFYYIHKNIAVFPGVAGVIATAVSLSLPASGDLMFIDKNGKSQRIFRFNIKKLLRDNPELYKKFKAEVDPSESLTLQYLILYNHYMMHK